MSEKAIDLYELIPSVHRLRDAERGYPLRALLEIITEQANVLKWDIDGLWDDFFIETCADWVIPYIGELVGNNPLYEIEQGRRADVAKTIYYRRRKGVLPMLEELARDVSGWGVHAVAAFENLGWTQNVNHVRYTMAPNPDDRFPNSVTRVGTANLRHMDAVDRLDTAFDTLSHSVDVRPADSARGWHNIRKINFFLWRLEQFPLSGAPAKQSISFANGFTFSAMGNPAPLFNNPEREASETDVATEIHVPGPIRPAAFYFDPSDYYGPGKSFAIYRGYQATDENLIPQADILCKDLSTWSEAPAGKVAVDVTNGRFSFASGEAPSRATVVYNYGFSASMGAGPYNRVASLAGDDDASWRIAVQKGTPIDSIQRALDAWISDGKPNGIIEIVDNELYGGLLEIQMPARSENGGRLVIQAADGRRPLVNLIGRWRISAPDGDADLILNGLLIQGSLQLSGDLKLTLQHGTLVPGRLLLEDGQPRNPDLDSITTTGDVTDLKVTIKDSIVGPLRLPGECEGLIILDSVVDAPDAGPIQRVAIAADDAASAAGPPTTIDRSTIWGRVFVKTLDASDTIFNYPIDVTRQQVGCLRFSYAPVMSTTPRRHRCQPDLALEAEARRLNYESAAELSPAEKAPVLARIRPAYTSVHYGDPAYAQLAWRCPGEIAAGAEDGSEMGVFCSLKQPQRETNLRIRLEEYLPFGLEAGLIYVT